MSKKSRQGAIKLFGVALVALTIVGCAGEDFNPPATQTTHGPEALLFVGNDGDGTVSVIEHGQDGNTVVKTIPVGSGNLGDMVATTEGHVFVNVTDNDAVAAIDPIVEGPPEFRNFLPVGERPVHMYRDPEGTRVWVMNDGDATSGPCKTAGPNGTATNSVTVIQNHEVDGGGGGGSGMLGEVTATICVGRGHHKAAFSFPTEDHPNIQERVFVSNIKDGTISVIDNEKHIKLADGTEADNPEYLHVIATIDLCDSDKQTGGCDADLTTPNGSVPHGIDYSPHSGRIYNANVAYGTVVVIDPETNAIEATIDLRCGGCANKTHASSDGHFIVVKGTDKVSDPDHVIGKLTVIDVTNNTFTQIDLPDIHPDSFEFTPDEHKLYVTSATTGSDAQKAHLKNNVVLVFHFHHDEGELELDKEITVGVADGGHRAIAIHEHNGEAEHVVVPNPAEDTVSIIDPKTDTVVDTIAVGDDPGSILVFPLENASTQGGHTHG